MKPLITVLLLLIIITTQAQEETDCNCVFDAGAIYHSYQPGAKYGVGLRLFTGKKK